MSLRTPGYHADRFRISSLVLGLHGTCYYGLCRLVRSEGVGFPIGALALGRLLCGGLRADFLHMRYSVPFYGVVRLNEGFEISGERARLARSVWRLAKHI